MQVRRVNKPKRTVRHESLLAPLDGQGEGVLLQTYRRRVTRFDTAVYSVKPNRATPFLRNPTTGWAYAPIIGGG